jgi:hypothetical protein
MVTKKFNDKPQDLQNYYINADVDENRNKVLNLMRLGAYSYSKGYFQDSSNVFDEVLLNIESMYGENKESEKARSLWYSESEKKFIGEPYERAMAYFYRGMLYIENSDFENARASFKGGLLQDARAEDEQYRSDFTTLLIMNALSSRINNDITLFEESLQEIPEKEITTNTINARHKCVPFDYNSSNNLICKEVLATDNKIYYTTTFSPDVIQSIKDNLEKDARLLCDTLHGEYKNEIATSNNDYSKASCKIDNTVKFFHELSYAEVQKKDLKTRITNDNVFILIGAGYSPVKRVDPERKNILDYWVGSSKITPIVQLGNQEIELVELDDIYFQASTRGGREIDKIIDGKVEFKDNAMATGKVLKEG